MKQYSKSMVGALIRCHNMVKCGLNGLFAGLADIDEQSAHVEDNPNYQLILDIVKRILSHHNKPYYAETHCIRKTRTTPIL